MFGTIFTFELKRWLKNPTFYIYCALFFAMGMGMVAASLGVFDGVTATTTSNEIVNSPIAINSFLNSISILIYFLLPSIVGATVYRDFKYNMHTVLFSYPFSKANYLFAKFLSSFVVVVLISLFIAIGFYLGTFLPGVNRELLGEHNLIAYVQSYLYFIIPNLFFYGVIIFSVVTITRNVSIGFIAILLLLFIQGIVGSFTEDSENKYVLALFEPFGSDALSYYTKYWTVFDKNENLLPFSGVIVWNRLLWMAVSGLIFALIYRYFSFTQTALSFKKSKSEERVTKNNFSSTTKIELLKPTFDFSFTQKLKTAWSLSNTDFKFIVKNWIFISIVFFGMIFILLTALSAGAIFGTPTLPVTWQMLAVPGGTFSLFINILTFLFTGILIHRGITTRMNHLIDVTPTPNWVLLLSKFIAIVKMQMVLLSVIMISGIMFQIYKGYYHFEIGHYLTELYGLSLINFVIWALLAVLIQTLFKNYFLGLFVLLILSIGLTFLPMAGIEQDIFIYNSDSNYQFSDMNGYGHDVQKYFLYKFYWLLLGIVFFGLALLLWQRGTGISAKERLHLAKANLTKKIAVPLTIALLCFLAIGGWIYYEDNIVNINTSEKDAEKQTVEYEKKYKKFHNKLQLRIVDVKIDMDLYPAERNIVVNGKYILKNKTDQNIDSLFVNHDWDDKISFSVANKLVSKDTVHNFNIYKLEKPLAAGDSIVMNFTLKNRPNTLLKSNSPVIYNGTFINNGLFPSFGYNADSELEDDDVRKKYGMKPKDRMAKPTDAVARRNTYISNDADWITFETTISTADDQTAIAPGYLQKQWKKDNRNYFTYKMDRKMLNFYAFNSGRYEVKRDKWKDVNIEIYYHKGHEFNVQRMIDGVKKSLDYYTENFSPYQHKQVRIIEFPRTGGQFAQSFANTIPFSEAIGFIADVDKSDENAVDYPFAITAHEVAHQWWAHQVIGANVQGATVLSESLSEYSSLKVLEKQYGKSQMRKFLKNALDKYLQGRTMESKKERPLMLNENQQYIHYNKGSVVLYALSDYIGEKNMNNALAKYVKKVAFQEAPYTNSIELVDELRLATPDSLKYLINDMFETITLYDNRIAEAKSKKLPNGTYQIDISFEVAKYKANDKGKKIYKNAKGQTLTYTKKGEKKAKLSYPLNDYIEIGVFAEQTIKGKKSDKELYLKKVKINKIENKATIIVKEKPTEVGVDPYNKLIDTDSDDNRRDL